MPTVLNIKGFRFFFFSLEGNEPPHIHIEHDDCVAKFWLNPIQLASSNGFRSHELAKIRLLVIENKELFLEKWHEHFSN
ncbi:MAG: DUF4160 domain-containing protein [Burkholderiales bacterium]|nr:DUF4160 domain-containing protein [Burkholderiales bacterium]